MNNVITQPDASANTSQSKRITNIALQNYRAFFGNDYQGIKLPFGENVLIYGENGSGKSSLFKAINDYLAYSRNTTKPFIVNRYSAVQEGKVEVQFTDFDSAYKPIAETEQSYIFSTGVSTNQVPFIQDAALVKGFLEYRNLLDVYLHKEPRPNLFDLIILNLLSDYIPIAAGGTQTLGQTWERLYQDLFLVYTRNERSHKSALNELPRFQEQIDSTLKLVFAELNTMLHNYFPEQGIEIHYTLKPLTVKYPYWKTDWHIDKDLRLDFWKDGVKIIGDYTDILNEARLSAFAVCLYLASLKCKPSSIPFKILYLDDIFIGLDASNRIPILKIIQNEFADYQIFISTYDRHWFELSKKYFEIQNPQKWKSLEFYVQKEMMAQVTFDRPLIIDSESEFNRGIRYLHHRSQPDYPAAANYFRKTLEKLIKTHVPFFILADKENVQYEDYKLGKILERTRGFLLKTGNDPSNINLILSLLNAIVHPLSHYSISVTTYKGELLLIEKAIRLLEYQLIQIDGSNNFKRVLDAQIKIKLTFCFNADNDHYFYYVLKLDEPFLIKKVDGGIPELMDTSCHGILLSGNEGARNYAPFRPTNGDGRFLYSSIEEAYEKTFNHLNQQYGNFPKVDYQTICNYKDGQNWSPITTKIIW